MKPGEALPVGHLLDGRYRIHKVLGQGGMGRVYLANDTRLANRPVACKEMIIGDGIQEKKAIEDFNREARVLASLSHPSIPQVIDYFGEGGRYYLVMEYVAGGDLQEHLDKLGPHGRVPEAQVLRWMRQILDVLQFLHSQDPPIVYRDLKPGNIMIDHHGRAMLIDFGIARFLPPGGRGTQIGSVGYAPPEQYMGKMEPRSDLYSLAATMHHLLTGRDPQLEAPFSFPSVRQLTSSVSAQTERVIMQALDKDVAKRPASARDMKDALPDPGPDETAAASETLASQSDGVARISSMATIVLDQPAPVSTPAPLLSPISVAPTPASPSARPAPLGVKAKAASLQATQRGLALPLPIAPARKVSSTAKTKDLGLKPKPAPQPPSTERASSVKPASQAAPRPQIPSRTVTGPASHAVTDTHGAAAPTNRRPRSGGVVSTPPTVLRARAANPSVGDNIHSASARDGLLAARPEEVAGAFLLASGEGARFPLMKGRLVIGRSANPADAVDIDLSRLRRGTERVSRRHAEIIRRGVEYFIRDLGSLNGTYIAGRGRLGRDQLYKLKDRDEVVLGGAKLEFRRG